MIKSILMIELRIKPHAFNLIFIYLMQLFTDLIVLISIDIFTKIGENEKST